MKIVNCEICGIQFETKTTGRYCSSSECRKIVKSRSNKKFHSENKTKNNERRKKHYKENFDWYRKRDKLKWEKHKEKNPHIKSRRDLSHLEKKDRTRDSKKRYKHNKYHTDELYSLKNRFRSLLNKVIREGGFLKQKSTLDFLGCDWETFKIHIEKQFKEDMSWENRSLWDLDHIIPISEGKTIEDVLLLSHYTNFQPLWKTENIKKSNKW